jgi:predicted RNase H-like HicB family nuclease
MMDIKATIELWQKGAWFIAKLPELDFAAQGRTPEEAKANLKEVIKIQFEEMRELGTLDDYLAECGFVVKGDTVEPASEMIGFEKQLVKVA